MGCSAEPRNEPEPVWEKREKLEESERRESETVREWMEVLEEKERRELLSWWKMHDSCPKERVISLIGTIDAGYIRTCASSSHLPCEVC